MREGPTQYRDEQADSEPTVEISVSSSALSEQTKDELLATAEALGVEISASSSKAKIVEAIEQAGE